MSSPDNGSDDTGSPAFSTLPAGTFRTTFPERDTMLFTDRSPEGCHSRKPCSADARSVPVMPLPEWV